MAYSELTEQLRNDPLLKPGDAARVLGVDPRTLSRWAREGRISSTRTVGGHRRYRESEIRRVLAGES